jgi:acyl dehydratase
MAIDFATLPLGAAVAEFSPPASSPEDLPRYAHASGDLNPLHLKLDFARQAGFDNLVVHGMLTMAHLGRLLTDNFPADAIRHFGTRFEGVVTVGQAVKYRAYLKELTPTGALLSLEGCIEASGKRVISGTALIAHSESSGAAAPRFE